VKITNINPFLKFSASMMTTFILVFYSPPKAEEIDEQSRNLDEQINSFRDVPRKVITDRDPIEENTIGQTPTSKVYYGILDFSLNKIEKDATGQASYTREFNEGLQNRVDRANRLAKDLNNKFQENKAALNEQIENVSNGVQDAFQSARASLNKSAASVADRNNHLSQPTPEPPENFRIDYQDNQKFKVNSDNAYRALEERQNDISRKIKEENARNDYSAQSSSRVNSQSDESNQNQNRLPNQYWKEIEKKIKDKEKLKASKPKPETKQVNHCLTGTFVCPNHLPFPQCGHSEKWDCPPPGVAKPIQPAGLKK
jgi:hypothetical protein